MVALKYLWMARRREAPRDQGGLKRFRFQR